MSPSAQDERATPIRRDVRFWRAAFIVYAVALTTGTHWPKLDLGGPDVPAPDKIIHLIAFGGLTAMLLLSGWFARATTVGVIAVAWTFLDEITQNIPGIGRSYTLIDVSAGLLGVALALAAWWAFRPIGPPPARYRNILRWRMLEHAARGPVGVTALLLIAGGVTWMLIASAQTQLMGLIKPPPASAYIALLFSGIGAVILWRRLDAAAHTITTELLCPCCETACVEHLKSSPRAPCPECGAHLHVGLWSAALKDGPTLGLTRLWRPAALVLTIVIVLVGGFVFAVWNRPDWLPTNYIRYYWQKLPGDMRYSLDLTGLGLMLLLIVRLIRARRTRAFNRQADACRFCRYDVHALPTDAAGIGHCPECGAAFMRWREGPVASSQ